MLCSSTMANQKSLFSVYLPSNVISYDKILFFYLLLEVCGGLRWFAVVCGSARANQKSLFIVNVPSHVIFYGKIIVSYLFMEICGGLQILSAFQWYASHVHIYIYNWEKCLCVCSTFTPKPLNLEQIFVSKNPIRIVLVVHRGH